MASAVYVEAHEPVFSLFALLAAGASERDDSAVATVKACADGSLGFPAVRGFVLLLGDSKRDFFVCTCLMPIL